MLLQNNSPRPSLHNNQQDGDENEHQDVDNHTQILSASRGRGQDIGVGPGSRENNTSPLTPSQAATKTTLDDLMETLKKLEEEEKFPGGKPVDKNQTPQNWCK